MVALSLLGDSEPSTHLDFDSTDTTQQESMLLSLQREYSWIDDVAYAPHQLRYLSPVRR